MKKLLPLLLILFCTNSEAALVPSVLVTSSSNTDATSYTTASITPASYALVIAVVYSRQAVGATTPTLTGNGITWVQEDTVDQGTNRRTTLFRGMVASPTTEAVTIDFAGNTQTACGWLISQITGADTSGVDGAGAIVQNPTATTGTGTASSLTLAAFQNPKNMAFAVHSKNNGTAYQPGTFTMLQQQLMTENTQILNTQYQINKTAVSASWSGSEAWECMAVEVKAKSEDITLYKSTLYKASLF